MSQKKAFSRSSLSLLSFFTFLFFFLSFFPAQAKAQIFINRPQAENSPAADTMTTTSSQKKTQGRHAKIEFIEKVGILKNGIMAIGGETTGTILEIKDRKGLDESYELDLQENAGLIKSAQQFHNQSVFVQGKLQIIQGVERGTRRIIVVNRLTLRPHSSLAPATPVTHPR